MQKVFVGLSGGVDSAVSAALLKKEGYDVTGVFIKIWQPEFIECTWKEDRLDAMRVAAALSIPFREIDLSESYKEKVIRDMVENYRKGMTPNPDVLCNQHIKFGGFASWAFKEGADLVATGHYARIAERNGTHVLLRGVDNEKDQSYFLHRIERSVLARTLFPIGGMTKQEVRALALRFRLPVAKRPDSQGLCFIGDITLGDFLRRFISMERGEVLDMNGTPIGAHEGAALYTIGQRHGFFVEHGKNAREVHYVVEIDTAANTLSVSTSRSDAEKPSALIRDAHWMNGPPKLPLEAKVEVRYRGKVTPARIESGPSLKVIFEQPQIISPGQSLVIYQEDVCLGGGILHL